MIRNYLSVIFRNFLKSPLYAGINVSGFALGLLSVILIVRYVTFEMSYDKTLDDNIHRVVVHTAEESLASTAVPLGPALTEGLSQVQSYARFRELSGIFHAHSGDQGVMMDHFLMGDGELLSFFNVELLRGDSEALKSAGNVIISQSLATTFGVNLGSEVLFYDRNFGQMKLNIAGIMSDWPANSHIHANALVSLPTLNLYNKNSFWATLDNWGWNDFYTYVKLHSVPGDGLVNDLIDINLGSDFREQQQISLAFQPVAEIHTTSNLVAEFMPNNDSRTLNYLLVMAVFILLIATVNYVNLTSARGLQRSREECLRKNLGATRGQFIGQFNLEAMVLLAFSLILSITLYQILRPVAVQQLGPAFQTSWKWNDLLILMVFFIPVFMWSVLQPSWLLSAVSVIDAINGKIKTTRRGTVLRNGSILLQMIVSILLIFSSIFVYKQINFLQNSELGMNIDHLLVVQRPQEGVEDYGARAKSYSEVLKSIGVVENVTASGAVPGKGFNWSTSSLQVKGKEIEQVWPRPGFSVTYVDNDFVDTYQIGVLAGEGRYTGLDSIPRLILNQMAVNSLGLHTADAVPGLRLMNGDNEFEVAGVIDDYYHNTKKSQITPTVLLLSENPNFFTIRYNGGGDPLSTTTKLLSDVEELYFKYFPETTFQYFFMDELFEQQYQSEVKFGVLVAIFCSMAVFLSCIGLVGLSTFTLERRRKEMGIRKVLGASTSGLLGFLSADIVKMVVLSSLIAMPLAYYMASEWLKDYPYKDTTDWWQFVLPFIILLSLALFSVSAQILKLSKTNPVDSIRYE